MQKKTNSNEPGDWLFFAEAELEGIRTLAEGQVSYFMCRSKLAEALEKILKAELIRLGWFLEKTHDLQKLADDLVERKSDIAGNIQPLVEDLSESYFIYRYPGFDLEEEDWPELLRQLEAVEKLWSKASERVEAKRNNT